MDRGGKAVQESNGKDLRGMGWRGCKGKESTGQASNGGYGSAVKWNGCIGKELINSV